ncbi:MAG: transcription termination factor NusA [Patescibacteria group bacterium]|nr:transcription termination factor NusA [Patescibacteria group bacterium]
MAVLSDFLAAVNQIAAERGIEADDVIEAVEAAIRTGFKNNYDTGESLIVEIDQEKGTVAAYADKKVVKKVTDKATQVSLEDARMIEPKLKVGDHVQVDVTPEGDFGRIAVQAAKQVILQKVREAEKEAVMKEFKDKMGTIESGIIQRMDGDSVIVEIHKAQAVMPSDERLPGEFYKSGSRLKFLLKEIQKGPSGKQLVVSRADPKFLEGLFELEVPEIRSGSVEIKAIAREAGSRSKVGVLSTQEGVDPIGACVGQKGIRIDNITDELQGEKIDIILWDEDDKMFVSNSLSPAQVVGIAIDEKEQNAKVTVPDDQLSLAIGKDGQNVRLAAKLTGWRIDIEGETKEEDKVSEEDEKEEKSPIKKKKKSKKKVRTKKQKAENVDGGEEVKDAEDEPRIVVQKGKDKKTKKAKKSTKKKPKKVEKKKRVKKEIKKGAKAVKEAKEKEEDSE